MTLAQLTRLVPPPKRPVEAPRGAAPWKPHERELETALPADYKALIAAYGTGALDDFVWLANPFSTLMPWRPWFERILAGLRAVRASGGTRAMPHAVFPELDGILPWASTENGDVLGPIIDFMTKQRRWPDGP